MSGSKIRAYSLYGSLEEVTKFYNSTLSSEEVENIVFTPIQTILGDIGGSKPSKPGASGISRKKTIRKKRKIKNRNKKNRSGHTRKVKIPFSRNISLKNSRLSMKEIDD